MDVEQQINNKIKTRVIRVISNHYAKERERETNKEIVETSQIVVGSGEEKEQETFLRF